MPSLAQRVKAAAPKRSEGGPQERFILVCYLAGYLGADPRRRPNPRKTK
jgi:hypothetical protein